jgi:hypothetical protein
MGATPVAGRDVRSGGAAIISRILIKLSFNHSLTLHTELINAKLHFFTTF